MATRLCNFEPIFFTEKDIEMLQGINSLVEEEVSVFTCFLLGVLHRILKE